MPPHRCARVVSLDLDAADALIAWSHRVQIKTRDEVIPEAMRLIAQSPEAHVMIIVDTDAGPEVLQTHPSRIWSFGVLAAVEKMLDAEYKALKTGKSQKGVAAQTEMEQSASQPETIEQNRVAPLEDQLDNGSYASRGQSD